MYFKYLKAIRNWFFNYSYQRKEKLAKRLNLVDVHLYELGKEAGNLSMSEIKGIFYAKKVSAMFLDRNTDRMEVYAKQIRDMVNKEMTDWKAYRSELKKQMDNILIKRMWVE